MAGIIQLQVPEFQGRFCFEYHPGSGWLYLVTLTPPAKDGDLPKGEGSLLAKDVGDLDRAKELIAIWRHGYNTARPPLRSADGSPSPLHAPVNHLVRLPADLIGGGART